MKKKTNLQPVVQAAPTHIRARALAERYGVSLPTVYARIREGVLPCSRSGSVILIPLDAAKRCFEGGDNDA